MELENKKTESVNKNVKQIKPKRLLNFKNTFCNQNRQTQK